MSPMAEREDEVIAGAPQAMPDDGAPATAAVSSDASDPSGGTPLDCVSLADLRAEAEQVAADAVRRGLATDADLAPHRPGGAKNPDAGPRGWLRYFAVAHRFHARGERPGGGAGSSRGADTSRDDALVMKALTREPVRVRLFTDPDAVLHVHPKGLEAQVHIHALDVRVAWEASHIEWLKELATPLAMDALPHALESLAYTQQLLAWVVTSEGPELPYAVTDPRPEPPEHIRRLEAWDLVQINKACQSLFMRQQALTALVDARSVADGGKRMTWSQFIAVQRGQTGEDTLTLARHRTLDELLAAVRLDADAKAPREEAA